MLWNRPETQPDQNVRRLTDLTNIDFEEPVNPGPGMVQFTAALRDMEVLPTKDVLHRFRT